MQVDLSRVLTQGFTRVLQNVGNSGKVIICLILFAILLPPLLRVLSFFRRGGSGV